VKILLDPRPESSGHPILTPDEDNAERLAEWIAAVLPHLHAFTRGLDFDKQAVHAALTLPYHNGGTEGVNTKTKRIMRQMHGRAGFALLRHRILLGLHNALSPPEVRQSRSRDRPKPLTEGNCIRS
jgi:Transposase